MSNFFSEEIGTPPLPGASGGGMSSQTVSDGKKSTVYEYVDEDEYIENGEEEEEEGVLNETYEKAKVAYLDHSDVPTATQLFEKMIQELEGLEGEEATRCAKDYWIWKAHKNLVNCYLQTVPGSDSSSSKIQQLMILHLEKMLQTDFKFHPRANGDRRSETDIVKAVNKLLEKVTRRVSSDDDEDSSSLTTTLYQFCSTVVSQFDNKIPSLEGRLSGKTTIGRLWFDLRLRACRIDCAKWQKKEDPIAPGREPLQLELEALHAFCMEEKTPGVRTIIMGCERLLLSSLATEAQYFLGLKSPVLVPASSSKPISREPADGPPEEEEGKELLAKQENTRSSSSGIWDVEKAPKASELVLNSHRHRWLQQWVHNVLRSTTADIVPIQHTEIIETISRLEPVPFLNGDALTKVFSFVGVVPDASGFAAQHSSCKNAALVNRLFYNSLASMKMEWFQFGKECGLPMFMNPIWWSSTSSATSGGARPPVVSSLVLKKAVYREEDVSEQLETLTTFTRRGFPHGDNGKSCVTINKQLIQQFISSSSSFPISSTTDMREEGTEEGEASRSSEELVLTFSLGFKEDEEQQPRVPGFDYRRFVIESLKEHVGGDRKKLCLDPSKNILTRETKLVRITPSVGTLALAEVWKSLKRGGIPISSSEADAKAKVSSTVTTATTTVATTAESETRHRASARRGKESTKDPASSSSTFSSDEDDDDRKDKDQKSPSRHALLHHRRMMEAEMERREMLMEMEMEMAQRQHHRDPRTGSDDDEDAAAGHHPRPLPLSHTIRKKKGTPQLSAPIETLYLQNLINQVLSSKSFKGFASVTHIDLSGGGVSCTEKAIPDGFLSDCKLLVRLDLPADLSSVDQIGSAFLCGCLSLEQIDLSGFTNVKTIKNGFLAMCPSLLDVDLSPMGSSLSKIGNNFLATAETLQSVDLTPLKNITEVGENFLGYSKDPRQEWRQRVGLSHSLPHHLRPRCFLKRENIKCDVRGLAAAALVKRLPPLDYDPQDQSDDDERDCASFYSQ